MKVKEALDTFGSLVEILYTKGEIRIAPADCDQLRVAHSVLAEHVSTPEKESKRPKKED